MGEVVELSRYRPQHPDDDTVDRVVGSELLEQASTNRWLSEFAAGLEDDMAMSDLHFMCVNGPQMDRLRNIIADIEAVVPRRQSCALVDDVYATEVSRVLNMPMREIAAEVTHSSHVLWMSLPEHYAALASEYRRRIISYDRMCERLTKHP